MRCGCIASRHTGWAILGRMHSTRPPWITARHCSLPMLPLSQFEVPIAESFSFSDFSLTISFPFPLAHLPFKSFAFGQKPRLFIFKYNRTLWIIFHAGTNFLPSRIHFGRWRLPHLHRSGLRWICLWLAVRSRWGSWSPRLSLEISRMIDRTHRLRRRAESLRRAVPLHFWGHVHSMRRRSSIPCITRLVHPCVFGCMWSSVGSVVGWARIHSWRSVCTGGVSRCR